MDVGGGAVEPGKKSAGASAKRRARREHFGELVQMDGSFHEWLEGTRARAAA